MCCSVLCEDQVSRGREMRRHGLAAKRREGRLDARDITARPLVHQIRGGDRGLDRLDDAGHEEEIPHELFIPVQSEVIVVGLDLFNRWTGARDGREDRLSGRQRPVEEEGRGGHFRHRLENARLLG